MDTVVATLFFTGLTVFLAATVLFYVRLYRANISWGVAATILPPTGLLPYLIYMRKHAPAAVLILVGGYTALVCGVLWLRMNPESIPTDDYFRLRHWLVPAAADGVRYERAFPEVGSSDSGELAVLFKGESARWERIEWNAEVVRFSTGGPGIPAAMLQIRLPAGWEKTSAASTLSVTPTDPNPPVVELLTYDAAAGDEPVVKVFKRGYWLDLAVTETQDTFLAGRIKLVLPSAYKTWLSGDFVANPEGIRYVNGELDRHYDSTQTLARIGASHVNAFLWRWMEGAPQVSNLHFQTSYEPISGQGLARVNLGAFGLFDLPLSFRKTESGWYVVPDAVPVVVASLEMQTAPPAAGNAPGDARAGQAAPSLPQEIDRFAFMQQNIGLEGELHTVDGRRIRGEVMAAEGSQIRLRRELEGNQLVVTVSETNFLKFVPLL